MQETAPRPPNISDSGVSYIALAARNASLHSLFKCFTPANAFETATKPSRLAHFWEGAESLAPATRNHILMLRNRQFFLCILTWACASCHNAVHFLSISTSKSAPRIVLCMCILTSKCASRHNGVQFFISHLARWLRTRRFSEPLFEPPEPQNFGKTQCFATFLPFRAPASSFF